MNEQLESTLTLASGIFLCTMLFSIFMEMLINGIDDIIMAIGNVVILFLTISSCFAPKITFPLTKSIKVLFFKAPKAALNSFSLNLLGF